MFNSQQPGWGSNYFLHPALDQLCSKGMWTDLDSGGLASRREIWGKTLEAGNEIYF